MRVFLGLIVICIFAVPAYAEECYSKAEVEAEQGIRIHSELMVIGLNCQHMGKRYGMDLYSDYRRFTNDHASLFSKYEDILIGFFTRRGDAKPEASLNTLRTNFANNISTDAAAMRPDIFCAKYVPRIEKASVMDRDDIRRWASVVHESHPVSYPACPG